jgi:hypothetical protein
MTIITTNSKSFFPTNGNTVLSISEALPSFPKQRPLLKDLPSFFDIPREYEKEEVIVNIPRNKQFASILFKLSLKYNFECDQDLLKYGEAETLFYYNYIIHATYLFNEVYRLSYLKIHEIEKEFINDFSNTFEPEFIYFLNLMFSTKEFDQLFLKDFFILISGKNQYCFGNSKITETEKVVELKEDIFFKTFHSFLSSRTFDKHFLTRIDSFSKSDNIKETIKNYMKNFFERQKNKNFQTRKNLN